MSALLEEIRSRGYWKIVVRPTTFVEKRVLDQKTLEHILRTTSVSLRGWSFPHVDDFVELDSGKDWIGQGIAWDRIRELWRFYQSGQFVHYFGMIEDWVDNSAGQWLPSNGGRRRVSLDVKNVVAQFTEVFEFAARLSFTEAGDSGTHMEIIAGNINDHVLQLPSRPGEAYWIPQARKPSMTYITDLSNGNLVADKRDLALKASMEFFRCFNWDPRIKFLRDVQAGILDSRQEQPLGRFISQS